MKLNRVLAFVLVLASLLIVSAFSVVGAQDDAPPVLILPIDQANFLTGARFDFRVEVHTGALPEDFAVAVNGTPAAEFFGAEPTEETWEFGGSVASYVAEGTPGDDFSLETLATDYYNSGFGAVTIAVDGENLTGTVGGDSITLNATDDPLAYTVVGGVADGQTLTFGLDAEGALTGFSVAGQNFGVLTSLPTQSQSVIWRDLVAPAPGEYTVEVTAGGASTTVNWVVREPIAGTARNVILFVGDGMTVPMISAARAARGMKEGRPTNPLFMDSMEVRGFVSTSSVDSLMADSANTASALNTGHIGSVNATGSYSDTSPSRLDDPKVETLAEMLKRTRGYSIGSVTTADASDATPAAVWAHGRDRSDGSRAAFFAQALDSGTVDVILGGGLRRLLPQSAEGSRRTDDRDLIAEYEAAGFTIVDTATALAEVMGGEVPSKLLGMFAPSDLNTWLDRNVYTDNIGDLTDQPGLVDMTLAALEVLNTNPNGFYLAVEAASIDKQIHPLDQERALSDLIEMDQAIEAAAAWVAENAPDTLIVVTADHGHGYEVYGTVDTTLFNAGTNDLERRRAIRVYAAARYPDYPDADGDGFPEWGDATITFAGTVNNGPEHTEDFQVSETPRVPAIQNDEGIYVDNPEDDPNGIFISGTLDPASSTGVHTLMDNAVYASGPGAEYFNMSAHQSEIFFGMAAALGLDPSAEDGMIAAAAPTVTTAGVSFPASASSLALLALGLVGGLLLGRARRK